jgi:hypothetical protein
MLINLLTKKFIGLLVQLLIGMRNNNKALINQ